MAESCNCTSPKPMLIGIGDGVPVGPGSKPGGINTLMLFPDKCTGCGRCQQVCPHRVFEVKGGKAAMVNADACMECGACMMNCPESAIKVDSGVGCAMAMIKAALKGSKEVTCGDDCCN
ncbi:MAG: Ferredoxin [Methanomassiliicoccales archaeon PtaU1.Bin124]|nr:MAG: Ferredoxin [Methanomassiliicoccales archaeon PtaU1.Bin124]